MIIIYTVIKIRLMTK